MTSDRYAPWQHALFLIFIFLSSYFFLSFLPVVGTDWEGTFYSVSHNISHPYMTRSFINPPWVALALYSFRFFSMDRSKILNAALTVTMFAYLIIRRGGGILPFIVTMTSFPLVATICYSNIEWIIAFAFILHNKWGIPLLVIKPQSGILAGFSWFMWSENKLAFIVPGGLVIASSFLIWGNWISKMIANVKYVQSEGMGTWNISPFPYLFPVGLVIMFYILIRRPKNSELLAVGATLCVAPYFAYQSLAVPLALFSMAHKKLSIVVWVLLWILPFWRAM